jgi:hypothetical protein
MVKLKEAENQIVIDYEVYDRRPSDSDLLIAAIESHRAMLGRPPHMVAADAAFYSAKNEAAAKAQGVKRVCIPNTVRPRAPSASVSRGSTGSAAARSGGSDARDASAWAIGGTVSTDAITGAMSE